jgi:hypothetical protein
MLTQCEGMKKGILVSAQLMNRLELPVIYTSETCGEAILKGKRKPLGVFTIKETDTHKQFWPDKIL